MNFLKNQLTDVITKEQYLVPEGTFLTLCVLSLQNGFTVVGEAPCSEEEFFDAAAGKDIALFDALSKIYQLEAYAGASSNAVPPGV